MTTVVTIPGDGAIALGTTQVDGTVGSVLFIGTGGVIQQNNANFFWSNAVGKLAIGTTSNTGRVDIQSSASGAYTQVWKNSSGSFMAGMFDDTGNALLVLRNSAGTTRLNFDTGTSPNYIIGNVLIGRSTAVAGSAAKLVVQSGAATQFAMAQANSLGGLMAAFYEDTDSGGGLFLYNGSSTITAAIWGNAGNDSYLNGGGKFGVGTASPATMFEVCATDAVTATVTNAAAVCHASSGTPAAGFGAGLAFKIQSTTTANRTAGVVSGLWATATDASRKGRVVLSASDATTDREGIRVESDGSNAMLGFFGVTAVVRPAALTQTYSTADTTLSAYTPNAQSSAYTGSSIDSEAKLTDLNLLRIAYENLRAFTEDLAQFVNSLVDQHQAMGLSQ